MKMLESFVFDKMRKTKLPGLAIAISKDGKIIYKGTFGFRDIERGLPVTEKTHFGIGSITKSFTCLAILNLEKEGKLSIDDPVSKYVPFKEGVKIWHLMSHVSGIPALGYAEATIRQAVGVSKKWYPIAKEEDVLRFMKDVERWHTFDPEKRWFYLNEGYEILGMIVEKVSNMSFKEYLLEKIVRNMGIDCVFLEDMNRVEMAQPYVVRDGKIEKSVIPLGAIGADGGLACSIDDLIEYANFYLKKGFDFIEEMEKIRVDLPYKTPFGRSGYGYGLMVQEDFLGRRIVGHGGSILVYTAHFLYSRSDNVGVAVLSNSSGYPMGNLARYAMALAIGEDPKELPFVKLDEVYEKLTGRYATYMGTVEVEVSRIGDFLKIEYLGSLSEPEILVPDDLDGGVKKFHTLSNSNVYPVEFFEEGGKVLMVHERFLYEKVG